ncbi:helix-turn-helix transcriptional regulator [Haloechinothrix sp. LS1_15]|uniref:helix-turn-helix transcriptional regulator n=1 Tax=Haloechinothrix sp. LS1_15 TaxID=2652248 RepID=UPI002945DC90|nr:helix-turn-helix transcriptional regulator [Haloechinothrix sp. LS1_15]MDV6012144.1 helix-turn-helix transcriptional regulator [Haloechinothrix sp. LS1_15]
MEEISAIQKNIELQRQWYGEPLGDRVRRLIVAFDVSQAYLAEVLGISAPMLSQVMSGRRAKIGNPAVLARLIMLERKVLTPGVAAGVREAMIRAMDEVRDSTPSVGRDDLPVHRGIEESTLLAVLRDIADGEDLVAASERLGGDFPVVADLLRRAANAE